MTLYAKTLNQKKQGMFYLYFGVGDHPRQRGINYDCRRRSGGTNFGGGPLTAGQDKLLRLCISAVFMIVGM